MTAFRFALLSAAALAPCAGLRAGLRAGPRAGPLRGAGLHASMALHLRCPTSEALPGATPLSLAASLLRDGGPFSELRGEQLHCWDDGELSELQWPPLEAAARRQRDEWQAFAASNAAELGVAPDDLLAALGVAHAHGLSCDEMLWLVPGTAALGRSAPRGANLEREADELLLVGGEGGLNPGEGGVSISSGWRSNDELLLKEGWAAEDNACDAFQLPTASLLGAAEEVLGADVVASLAGAREEVLKEMVHNGYLAESADGDESRVGTIDPSDGFLSTGRPLTFADTAGESGGLTEVFSGGYVSDSCGRYLQALAVTDVEISEYGPMGLAISIGEGVPLSVFHERRVGELLAAACEAILGGFATTSQHDEALLEADGSGSELAPRARQAIRSRLARKRALTEILERARQWVEQPTAAGGTLRRPWRVHVRTSG